MLQRYSRYSFILLMVILVVLPVISQETTNPPVDLTATTTLTPSPTASWTPNPTLSIAEITPELTPEVSATPSPTATSTQADVTAEVTAETTESPVEETIAPELTMSASASPELTEAVEVTAVVTEASPIAVSSITPTATAGGFNLEVLRGQVKYQNRAEHSGISVSVLSVDGVLLSVAVSNARGVFSLPAPSDTAFILLFEAPLHRSLVVEVNPGNRLPNLVLAGGDLNHDGCINNRDMQQLLPNYELENTPLSDINADGLTDLSDLAILTGNFDETCGIVAESTEAAQ